jgi:hypothetical protein
VSTALLSGPGGTSAMYASLVQPAFTWLRAKNKRKSVEDFTARISFES